jgi:hypothetical protein
MNCAWCGTPQHIFRPVSPTENVGICCRPYEVPSEFTALLDEAMGSFSFSSRGVGLTYDFRKSYNKLILSREWRYDL